MSSGQTNGNIFIQKLFTSRDNWVDGDDAQATANAAAYAGEAGRLWYNPQDSTLRIGTIDPTTGNLIPGGVPAITGGGGTPGLPDTSVQFNDNGVFAGASGFTFDNASGTLTVGNISVTSLGGTLGNVALSSFDGNLANVLYGNGVFASAGGFGATGATGVHGSTGATGATGLTGATGPAGTSVTILGSVTDVNGLYPNPSTGPNGPNDPQGCLNYYFPTAVVSNGVIDQLTGDLWVYDGALWVNVGPIAGPQGATGLTGSGATGATGPQGDIGATGIQGSTGPDGATGVQGPQGDPGSPGGATGVKGTTGATGVKGTTGATGVTGATGATGPNGATGATGPGVPIGGTQGQALLKTSATNYATAWNYPISSVTSNITSLLSGVPLLVHNKGSSATYPSGEFVIWQNTPTGVTLSMTDLWSSSSATSKNQYANYAAVPPLVLNSDVSVTFAVSNGTITPQAGDTVTIDGYTLDATTLGIPASGGTITVPYSSLGGAGGAVQTTPSTTTSFSLTTSDATTPVKTGSGTTITTVAPIVFDVTSVTASWTGSAGSIPFWQAVPTTVNYTVNKVTGTTITGGTGTLTYANTASSVSGTLVSGSASGTSVTTLDPAFTWTITASSYYGVGGNGGGGKVQSGPVNTTLAAITSIYQPGFVDQSSLSATPPTFTTSSTYVPSAYSYDPNAPTAFPQKTVNNNYYWMAIPSGSPAPLGMYFAGNPFGAPLLWMYNDIEYGAGGIYDPTPITQVINGVSYDLYGASFFVSPGPNATNPNIYATQPNFPPT
jgi:hypothetical protein